MTTSSFLVGRLIDCGISCCCLEFFLLRLFLLENLEHVKGEGKGVGCIEQKTFE